MPLFNAPSYKDFLRLEHKVDNLSTMMAEHVATQNGHPAKIVWKGMTWVQLIGLIALVTLLVMVCALVGVNFFAELPAIREFADSIQQPVAEGAR